MSTVLLFSSQALGSARSFTRTGTKASCWKCTASCSGDRPLRSLLLRMLFPSVGSDLMISSRLWMAISSKLFGPSAEDVFAFLSGPGLLVRSPPLLLDETRDLGVGVVIAFVALRDEGVFGDVGVDIVSPWVLERFTAPLLGDSFIDSSGVSPGDVCRLMLVLPLSCFFAVFALLVLLPSTSWFSSSPSSVSFGGFFSGRSI